MRDGKKVIITTILLISAAVCLYGANQEGKCAALVVGNSAYKEEWRLQNPVNDARDMRQALESLGFEVRSAENADLAEIESAIRSFTSSLRPGDVAFFFYSGHGMQIDGENYLVPTDFDAANAVEAKHKCYSANLLLDLMIESGAKLNVVVLDACRSNPFRQAKSLERGLAAMNAGGGALIAYATAPGDVAGDNPVERNGLYTKHLLEAMRVPGLEIEGVFKLAREAVYRASNQKQLPWTASSVVGEFVLNPVSGDIQNPLAEQAYGVLKITVNLAEAEILIDGRRVGVSTGPQTLILPRMPVGYHTVTVRKEGHKSDVVDQQTAIHKGKATELEAWLVAEKITDSIGMELRIIPAGFFMMGTDADDKAGAEDETPLHRVEISKPFYIGVYEVTQGQYEAVMGENPSNFKGGRRPVESVSRHDAEEFCRRLSEKEGATYRLPTEAEWEYAARAGTSTRYYWGTGIDGRYAWYDDNSGKQTHDVGLKLPNPWGLYDVSGNVWEWCEDWYDHDYYNRSPLSDPLNLTTGENCVARGGSWKNLEHYVLIFRRGWDKPGNKDPLTGFRVVREIE
jgi:formylglycine-generating enzyme required for sulfatase activity